MPSIKRHFIDANPTIDFVVCLRVHLTSKWFLAVSTVIDRPVEHVIEEDERQEVRLFPKPRLKIFSNLGLSLGSLTLGDMREVIGCNSRE